MALPVSTQWDLADFDAATIGTFLTLSGDISFVPSATPPYFAYDVTSTILQVYAGSGTVSARLDTAVPARFTVEITVRLPQLPANTGDLAKRRLGLTVADGAGRGFTLYFSAGGIAVGRVDDFGAVSTLPDTANLIGEAVQEFRTIRVAVDSSLGRAYVYTGSTAGVQHIIPVQASPTGVLDTFQLVAVGTTTEPVAMEITELRLSSELIIPDYPPIADAGPDSIATVGNAVRLDGRRSSDNEGVHLRYQWTVTDAPFGSDYAAEVDGGVTIDDGDADGFTTDLSFDPLGLPDWVGPGDVVQIGDARGVIDTVDNPGGTLVVTQEVLPDSLNGAQFRVIRQSLLIGSDTETPYFVPDQAGLYRISLVVNDGLSDSEPSETLVSAASSRAPTGVEPNVAVLWKALGDDWKLVENKGIFEETWRGVAQVLSGKLLEVWQYHYNYSIKDAQRTFQRKWLAYRTLLADTGSAEVSPRYGAILASHRFDSSTPTVTGETITVTYTVDNAPVTLTATLTGDTALQIIDDLNTAFSSAGVEAYGFGVREAATTLVGTGTTIDDGNANRVTDLLSFTPVSLPSWVAPGDTVVFGGVRSIIDTVDDPSGEITVVGGLLPEPLIAEFRIYQLCRIGLRASRNFSVGGTAFATLGFTFGPNYLKGDGALVTDRTYYAEGIDFSQHGIVNGDLLVLNNGQSFSISGLATSVLDPLPYQRLVTYDELPDDATATWDVPDILRGDQDYALDGVYPGDWVKAEVFDIETSVTTDVKATVVAQRFDTLAIRLDEYYAYLGSDQYEVKIIGVKRRKAIPIHADTVSIPDLQDLIPVVASPIHWKENIDYVIEPLYRDLDQAPIPALQFRDAVFIDTDGEPPDLIWAETTILSNDANIESLFGRLTGFLRDDASAFPRDFNYSSGVAGLMYSQRRGPTLAAVEIGAQILFGQSFAEAAGTVEEIRNDFSPRTGRILVRDLPSGDLQSEVVRAYYYKKDPLDVSTSSGLAVNPETGVPWALGDEMTQFAPIGAGVSVVDMYEDPTWFVPHVRSHAMSELEKFHTFGLRFNADLVALDNLALLLDFIKTVRPKYTTPVLIGERNTTDEIGVTDDVTFLARLQFFDSPCGSPFAYRYDDYRGDGTLWSSYDDAATQYDALVDCPTDLIDFVADITWPGGNINTADDAEAVFFAGTDGLVYPVAPPGAPFAPSDGMLVAAGTYTVTVNVKTAGVLP